MGPIDTPTGLTCPAITELFTKEHLATLPPTTMKTIRTLATIAECAIDTIRCLGAATLTSSERACLTEKAASVFDKPIACLVTGANPERYLDIYRHNSPYFFDGVPPREPIDITLAVIIAEAEAIINDQVPNAYTNMAESKFGYCRDTVWHIRHTMFSNHQREMMRRLWPCNPALKDFAHFETEILDKHICHAKLWATTHIQFMKNFAVDLK